MKKGDVVTIYDGSWSRTIKDNKLVCGPGSDDVKQYIIIETGCSFPLYDGISHQKNKHRSDTIIQAIDSGEITLIYGAFLCLVLPTHKVMIDVEFGVGVCGKIVEISDELYRQIKK